jgi:hypothetical protein
MGHRFVLIVPNGGQVLQVLQAEKWALFSELEKKRVTQHFSCFVSEVAWKTSASSPFFVA